MLQMLERYSSLGVDTGIFQSKLYNWNSLTLKMQSSSLLANTNACGSLVVLSTDLPIALDIW